MGLKNKKGHRTKADIPLPAIAASLSYFEALRHDKLPVNLIQAQRDYFGAHTYNRIDQSGTIHTQWEKYQDD